MKLNVADTENIRKRVKILIPQMKKSEIVKNFEKEGIARTTIYNTINKMKSLSKTKIKRAAQPLGQVLESDNSKDWQITKGVSQRGLGKKFC